jgi:hypothetical protein
MNAETMIYARYAADEYREAADRLEREARLRRAKGQPVSERIIRHWAAIARNAARAEFFDPPPEVS